MLLSLLFNGFVNISSVLLKILTFFVQEIGIIELQKC